MPHLTPTAEHSQIVIQIGGFAVSVACRDSTFLEMLEDRYRGFVSSSVCAHFQFDVDFAPLEAADPDSDVFVEHRSGRWTVERGDFRAEWDSASGVGRIQLLPNPYSMDALLRILHTLDLARQGGFLLHGASAIRNGKAFVFTGASGAGKTTIAGLAPSDTVLLSDEISYICKRQETYIACGTPFAGELGRLGENVSAPLASVYLLAQGPENRIDALSPSESVEVLLPNLLFFAVDRNLVDAVFQSVCAFAERVPVLQLTFFPDSQVWELVR